MLFKGTLIGAASGKLGGSVASHNSGGQYMRKLSIPTNTNTPAQQAVRNAVKALTLRWTSTLTALQRTGWATYAQNVARKNRLGDSINISGLAWYVACNVPRLQASLAVVDAAPTTFTLAGLTAPTGTITAANTTLSVAFTTSDAWANSAGGALLVYTSRPQSPGITFFAGPFQFAGKILGNGTPPTSPANVTMPFAAGPTGSKIFMRTLASNADGRVSSPFLATATV